MRRRFVPTSQFRGVDGPDRLPCRRCQAFQPRKVAACWAGQCVEIYCGGCRRIMGGFGPVGCPCDRGPGSGAYGHGTKAEQPRRRPPFKPSRRRVGWRR